MTPAEREQRLLAARFVMSKVGWVAVASGASLLVYWLRGVLVPLFLAFILAYALDPVIRRLEKSRVPRHVGAPVIMALLVVAAITLAVLAVPYFIREFVEASQVLSQNLQDGWARLAPWAKERFNITIPGTWIEATSSYSTALAERAPGMLNGIVPALFGTVSSLLVVFSSLIIPVFALYLLSDFDVILARSRVLIPRRYAATLTDVAREIDITLGQYFRGQLTASLVLSTLYSCGLSLVGIRLAIPIGVLTGFLAFVPYVGSATGFVLAVTMAVLDWQGPQVLFATVAVMLSIQFLDGMYLTPRIVGGSVGLKPLEVILTMMGAGTLFGFVGILLAVPIGAVLKIVLARVTSAYLQSSFYRDIPVHAPTPLPLSMARTESVPPPSTTTSTGVTTTARIMLTPIPRPVPAVIPTPVSASGTPIPQTSRPILSAEPIKTPIAGVAPPSHR